MDIARELVRCLCKVKFEDLPTDLVEVTKKEILDALATGVGGSSAPGIREVVDIVKDWGGKEESTILVYGGKVPAPDAVLANAPMMHALDFDDTHDGAVLHPAVVAVPTALAVAEARGGISGRDLITAVALGVDLGCRMRIATKLRKPNLHAAGGWHSTPLYGFFMAAAIAGRIMGLDEEKALNALGIAYHQAAGNVQCIDDGALTKRIGPGFAARGGIVAALMAEKGISGAHNIIEGECGFYNLYHDGFDLDKLTSRLGEYFKGVNISFKPYPCCRIGHRYIDAVLDMVSRYNIKLEEVEEVEVVAGNKSQTPWQPLEVKRKPRTIVDAQFSLPWMIACAIVRRRVGVQEFTQEAIMDPTLLKVAQLVKPVYDFSFEETLDSPMDVTIKTKRGEFNRKTVAPYGHPNNPLSLEAIASKLRDCASIAARPILSANLERVIELVRNLEIMPNVTQIMKLLS